MNRAQLDTSSVPRAPVVRWELLQARLAATGLNVRTRTLAASRIAADSVVP